MYELPTVHQAHSPSLVKSCLILTTTLRTLHRRELKLIWGLPKWRYTCHCRRRKRRGFHPLEEDMATHARILAWRIPWTEESGRL